MVDNKTDDKKTLRVRQGLRDSPQFAEWADRATAGIDRSKILIGVFDNPSRATDYEMAIQIGWCLLRDKPVTLVLPHGTPISDKLRAACTAIAFYHPDNEASFKAALQSIAEQMGLPVVN